MKKIFEYIEWEHVNSLKIVIGQFISSKIRKLRITTPEEFNSIDRIEWAKEFIDNVNYHGEYPDNFSKKYPSIKSYYTITEITEDIAIFIDQKLPHHYWKLKGGDKLSYPGKSEIPELCFVYEINDILDEVNIAIVSGLVNTRSSK